MQVRTPLGRCRPKSDFLSITSLHRSISYANCLLNGKFEGIVFIGRMGMMIACLLTVSLTLSAKEPAGAFSSVPPELPVVSPGAKPMPDLEEWTPFQFAIGPYYQIFPKERAVYGLGFDLLLSETPLFDRVIGLNVGGLMGNVRSCIGAQISLLGNGASNACGLQASGALNIAQQMRGVQFGAFCANVAETLEGAQFSLGGNRAADASFGLQVGGMNQADDRFTGLQIGMGNNPGYIKDVQYGTFNGRQGYSYRDAGDNHCKSRGAQVAIILNGGSSLAGVQIAGMMNEGSVAGLQITTIGNHGDINGLQVGGIVNESEGKSNGVQLGMFNIAKQLRGVQLGLFNKCQDLAGLQIGLWNRSGTSAWPLFRIGFGQSDSGSTSR